MVYATPADIEARLGRDLDESETQIVQARLGDAELIIRSRVPDLDAKVSDGVLDSAIVVMVESDMLLRLIKNPDGYTQESDGNYSYTLSEKVASGHLSVRSQEWALLGVRGAVYSIAPYVRIPTREWPPDVWRDAV